MRHSKLAPRKAIRFLLAAFAAACLIPATARGQIFISSPLGGTVGVYTTSGTPLNPTLLSGLGSPEEILLDGPNLFVGSAGSAIGKYISDGTPVNPSLVSGLAQPFNIAISGSHLFVANGFSGAVGEYDADTGTTINAALVTQINIGGIAVAGGKLFVVAASDGTIGEYDATTGAIINPALVSGLKNPEGLAISGSNLFVANRGISNSGYVPYSGSIGEYTLTGATVNASLISGLNFPRELAMLATISLSAASGMARSANTQRRAQS
jgi:hypothetical protein